jgi:hypothetical protein
MMLVMEEEAERLVGPRHQQDEQRCGYRWGNEAGYCVVDGQKVPIERIRLRSKDGRELPLGSYQLFQRSAPLEDGVWWKMMRGFEHPQLWGSDEDFSPGLRGGEISGE